MNGQRINSPILKGSKEIQSPNETRKVNYLFVMLAAEKKIPFQPKHYREVARWEIFMEQELRFGLDLGRFGNFLGRFFHVFMGKKKNKKNILDGENIFGIA